jgi:hypothetical protein
MHAPAQWKCRLRVNGYSFLAAITVCVLAWSFSMSQLQRKNQHKRFRPMDKTPGSAAESLIDKTEPETTYLELLRREAARSMRKTKRPKKNGWPFQTNF